MTAPSRENMQVAFLVLATKGYETFAALASWFDPGRCRFFVHVDAKFPTDPFEQVAASKSNVQILDFRLDIHWGGFSMIRAEVALMEKARTEGPFDRYVLLSDDCLPIRSEETIWEALSSDAEMISAWEPTEERIKARYEKFYWLDMPAMSPRNRPLITRGQTSNDVPGLLEFSSFILRGKKPLKALYHGSQWWALSNSAIKTFLSVYYNDDELRRSFEFSAIPDEHYIQTVLKLSDHSERITEGPMFSDGTTNPSPFIYTTAESIEKPMKSSKLFARKFPNECASIIGALKNHTRFNL